MQVAVHGVAASGAVVVVLVAGDIAGVHELVDDALGASLADADRLGQLPQPHVRLLGEADQGVAVIGNQRPRATIPNSSIVMTSLSCYLRLPEVSQRWSSMRTRSRARRPALGVPPEGYSRNHGDRGHSTPAARVIASPGSVGTRLRRGAGRIAALPLVARHVEGPRPRPSPRSPPSTSGSPSPMVAAKSSPSNALSPRSSWSSLRPPSRARPWLLVAGYFGHG